MGWKAYLIAIKQENGAAAFPGPHDAQAARALALKLLPGAPSESAETDLGSALYPAKTLSIGCYPGLTLISNENMACSLFDAACAKKLNGGRRDEVLIRALETAFPGASIYSFILHSVVNLWGIALLKDGKSVRLVAGSADDGIFSDVGAPLAEEKKVLGARSLAEASQDGDGEAVVFATAARIFGAELDRVELEKIRMSEFKYASAGPLGFFAKLFGRR